MEEPQNRENIRNPDGTFVKGVSGNPGGRPKNSMKDYVRIKFSEMTNEQKEEWLKSHNLSGIDQWKMAEGNPESKTDITSAGLPIIQVTSEVANKYDIGIPSSPIDNSQES